MDVIRVGEELKKQWDDFVSVTSADGGILQSWAWGDFQKFLNKQIFRVGLIDSEGNFQATALLIKQEVHFEYSYLYCPRGPVLKILDNKKLKPFFEEIKNIAREEKSFMVKADPAISIGNEQIFGQEGFRKSDKEVQAKCNLIISLKGSEDELLLGMKQKTRYNIGLAQKKEVIIRTSTELSDTEPFWQLVKQTSARDGFNSHPKEYYKKMFEVLTKAGTLKLFLAEYDQKIVAANMITSFGRTSTYLHGASADMYRGVMAPYLLQWQAMVEAKKLGLEFYDFGGVNGQSFFSKKWAGITRFKQGFSENTLPNEFVGGFDLVINPFIFSAYKLIKQIRG